MYYNCKLVIEAISQLSSLFIIFFGLIHNTLKKLKHGFAINRRFSKKQFNLLFNLRQKCCFKELV